MSSDMMGYSELQRRQDQLARNRENRGRMASASQTFDTTGSGVMEFEDRIDFGLIFIDKPRVHYGSEADADDLRNAADALDTDPLPLPTCSGTVVKWDTDENDYYVGAWVAVSVTFPLLTTPVVVDITHHFDFFGTGLKVIPHDPTD